MTTTERGTTEGVAASAWIEVLDQLEADAHALSTALTDGAPIPVQTWIPPRDLGPLPPELERRAERIVATLADAQQRTRERLTELSTELAGIDTRRKAGVAYANG